MPVPQRGTMPGMKFRVAMQDLTLARNPRNVAGWSGSFVDLSTRVIEFDFEVGSVEEDIDMTPKPTAMTILLQNQDAALDRLNTASLYYPGLKALRHVTLDWIWNGTTYAAWTGAIDTVDYGWGMDRVNTVQITAFDRIGVTGQMNIPATISAYNGLPYSEGAGDTSYERMNRVLVTKLGWNAADFGTAAAGSTQPPYGRCAATGWGGTALDHLVEAWRAEGGVARLYSMPNGDLRLTPRNNIRDLARSQATQYAFSTDAGSTSIRYTGITFKESRADLRNHAPGGAAATPDRYLVSESTTSIDLAGRHSTSKTDTPVQNSADAEADASWRVFYLSQSHFRVTSVSFNPRRTTVAMSKLLGTLPGDKVDVEWRTRALAGQMKRNCWVKGYSVSCHYQDEPAINVTMHFDPADGVFGSTALLGGWGVANILAPTGFRLGI